MHIYTRIFISPKTGSQKNETRKKNKKIQRNVHGKREQDNTSSNIRNGHDLNKIQTVPMA